MKARQLVVTGAAGFLGSHLCEEILRAEKSSRIAALDNLASGTEENIRSSLSNPRFDFRRFDIAKRAIPRRLLCDAEVVFHLAANPEVRIGSSDTSVDFNSNIVATRNLLEALKDSGFHGRLVFTSTSAVYGEPTVVPTPESYGPSLPISIYAASKLASEAMISAYAELAGFTASLIRFANVVGAKSNHGVVYDFIKKLETDGHRLEVLGDGSQTKSYIHVDDCVSAILHVTNLEHRVDVFNAGTREATNVMRIAEIVCEEMKLDRVKIVTKAVTKDGRAWPGDVKEMLLDCTKIARTGWSYRLGSDEAIRQATREILSTSTDRQDKVSSSRVISSHR